MEHASAIAEKEPEQQLEAVRHVRHGPRLPWRRDETVSWPKRAIGRKAMHMSAQLIEMLLPLSWADLKPGAVRVTHFVNRGRAATEQRCLQIRKAKWHRVAVPTTSKGHQVVDDSLPVANEWPQRSPIQLERQRRQRDQATGCPARELCQATVHATAVGLQDEWVQQRLRMHDRGIDRRPVLWRLIGFMQCQQIDLRRGHYHSYEPPSSSAFSFCETSRTKLRAES